MMNTTTLRRRPGRVLMLAGAVTLALLPALAACSTTPAPDKTPTTAPSTPSEPDSAGSDVKGACETFNDLAKRLREADESEKGVFLSIYEDARKSAENAPEDIRDALTAIGIVALDRDGGSVPQEDRDLMLEQQTRITSICETVDVQIVF